jgi:hypothetical protein
LLGQEFCRNRGLACDLKADGAGCSSLVGLADLSVTQILIYCRTKKVIAMQYAIIVYESSSELAKRTSPEHQASYWAAWAAYSKAIGEAGVMTGGAGLEPPSLATTVRMKGDKRIVQDGPFAETKEILGGFFLIEVPDLDAALEWGARCPAAATGTVEIRPLLRM